MHQAAEDTCEAPVRSVADAVRGWPSTDLGLLVVLLKRILDERADHHRTGGGVLEELKRHENRG